MLSILLFIIYWLMGSLFLLFLLTILRVFIFEKPINDLLTLLLLCLVWPIPLVAMVNEGVLWIIEKTPYGKRRKLRRRLRIAVSEQGESDESFLKRTKRL